MIWFTLPRFQSTHCKCKCYYLKVWKSKNLSKKYYGWRHKEGVLFFENIDILRNATVQMWIYLSLRGGQYSCNICELVSVKKCADPKSKFLFYIGCLFLFEQSCIVNHTSNNQIIWHWEAKWNDLITASSSTSYSRSSSSSFYSGSSSD